MKRNPHFLLGVFIFVAVYSSSSCCFAAPLACSLEEWTYCVNTVSGLGLTDRTQLLTCLATATPLTCASARSDGYCSENSGTTPPGSDSSLYFNGLSKTLKCLKDAAITTASCRAATPATTATQECVAFFNPLLACSSGDKLCASEYAASFRDFNPTAGTVVGTITGVTTANTSGTSSGGGTSGGGGGASSSSSSEPFYPLTLATTNVAAFGDPEYFVYGNDESRNDDATNRGAVAAIEPVLYNICCVVTVALVVAAAWIYRLLTHEDIVLASIERVVAKTLHVLQFGDLNDIRDLHRELRVTPSESPLATASCLRVLYAVHRLLAFTPDSLKDVPPQQLVQFILDAEQQQQQQQLNMSENQQQQVLASSFNSNLSSSGTAANLLNPLQALQLSTVTVMCISFDVPLSALYSASAATNLNGNHNSNTNNVGDYSATGTSSSAMEDSATSFVHMNNSSTSLAANNKVLAAELAGIPANPFDIDAPIPVQQYYELVLETIRCCAMEHDGSIEHFLGDFLTVVFNHQVRLQSLEHKAKLRQQQQKAKKNQTELDLSTMMMMSNSVNYFGSGSSDVASMDGRGSSSLEHSQNARIRAAVGGDYEHATHAAECAVSIVRRLHGIPSPTGALVIGMSTARGAALLCGGVSSNTNDSGGGGGNKNKSNNGDDNNVHEQRSPRSQQQQQQQFESYNHQHVFAGSSRRCVITGNAPTLAAGLSRLAKHFLFHPSAHRHHLPFMPRYMDSRFLNVLVVSDWSAERPPSRVVRGFKERLLGRFITGEGLETRCSHFVPPLRDAFRGYEDLEAAVLAMASSGNQQQQQQPQSQTSSQTLFDANGRQQYHHQQQHRRSSINESAAVAARLEQLAEERDDLLNAITAARVVQLAQEHLEQQQRQQNGKKHNSNNHQAGGDSTQHRHHRRRRAAGEGSSVATSSAEQQATTSKNLRNGKNSSGATKDDVDDPVTQSSKRAKNRNGKDGNKDKSQKQQNEKQGPAAAATGAASQEDDEDDFASVASLILDQAEERDDIFALADAVLSPIQEERSRRLAAAFAREKRRRDHMSKLQQQQQQQQAKTQDDRHSSPFTPAGATSTQEMANNNNVGVYDYNNTRVKNPPAADSATATAAAAAGAATSPPAPLSPRKGNGGDDAVVEPWEKLLLEREPPQLSDVGMSPRQWSRSIDVRNVLLDALGWWADEHRRRQQRQEEAAHEAEDEAAAVDAAGDHQQQNQTMMLGINITAGSMNNMKGSHFLQALQPEHNVVTPRNSLVMSGGGGAGGSQLMSSSSGTAGTNNTGALRNTTAPSLPAGSIPPPSAAVADSDIDTTTSSAEGSSSGTGISFVMPHHQQLQQPGDFRTDRTMVPSILLSSGDSTGEDQREQQQSSSQQQQNNNNEMMDDAAADLVIAESMASGELGGQSPTDNLIIAEADFDDGEGTPTTTAEGRDQSQQQQNQNSQQQQFAGAVEWDKKKWLNVIRMTSAFSIGERNELAHAVQNAMLPTYSEVVRNSVQTL